MLPVILDFEDSQEDKLPGVNDKHVHLIQYYDSYFMLYNGVHAVKSHLLPTFMPRTAKPSGRLRRVQPQGPSCPMTVELIWLVSLNLELVQWRFLLSKLVSHCGFFGPDDIMSFLFVSLSRLIVQHNHSILPTFQWKQWPVLMLSAFHEEAESSSAEYGQTWRHIEIYTMHVVRKDADK